MKEQKNTGYPSIDKPWLKYYSEAAINGEIPKCTVFRNIYNNNKRNLSEVAIKYFGNQITYEQLFKKVDECSKSLINLGINKGDCIAICAAAVPEVIYLMLSCSKIGAIANFINPLFTNEQKINLINNTNATLMFVLDEMTKYGVITYKRIYGDWTSPQAGKWKKELMENSITPIQQFRNTVGKNATDSTLIIDAMDILYTKNVDGFCIVSSDGDFTRLASRLRESGMEVIGMGENKTPRSFRAACSVFTDLELLQDQEDEEITAVNNKQRPNRSHNIIRISKIENAIIEIIQENDNKGKQTDLGEIGSRLQKKYSDFDVRNYGYSSLSTFINEMDGFKTYKVNNAVLVKLKEDDNIKEQVVKYAIDNVRASKATGVELAILGQRIHSQYPKFKAKEYGYSTLTKFVSSIKELLIETTDNKRIVFIRKKES